MIMAGGEGTRLRPLTSNQPKPLMPLANRPMMEHVVRLLKRHGFDEIVVTLAFLPQTIRSAFGDGSELGVSISYATEETPLGTAGSVHNARDLLDDTFMVISGDVLTDVDLGAIVEAHRERSAVATLALKSMENPLEFGIVITREDGSIERFLEKPTWGQVFSDTVNTGIYVLEPEVFDYIAAGEQVDFSHDVFPRMLADSKGVFGHVAEGYWEDVGTLEAYVQAHRDVLDQAVAVDIPGFPVTEGVWLGEGAEVHPDAVIDGPAIIGDYCSIAAGAHIGRYSVLGANVVVGTDADLERAVVHDNTYLGQGVRLRGAVVGRSCDLRANVHGEEGVVLGDDCFVGEHAVLNPGVKVYPFKTVEAGAIVNSSIVWESRGARSLFGRQGVTGLANVDITPELACRVAMAYATTLRKGDTVTTSRDSSRAGRALKRAVHAGLNAAGVDVDDLEMATVPVTRFQVRSERSQGGITVRLTPGDPQSVSLRFLDANGTDIDEGTQRKIERIFHRQEFRRAKASEIGDLSFGPRATEYYTAALMKAVQAAPVVEAGFKLVTDYAYGTTSVVMPHVLAKLGADVLSINPYASTSRAVAFDGATHAARVAELVKTSHADLGVVLGPDGEHLAVIDDSGYLLTPSQLLLAFVDLFSQLDPDSVIAVPISVTSAVETLAEPRGTKVIRTKVAVSHLMDTVAAAGATFAAGSDGGFVLGKFIPAFDATAALVKLLELLARSGSKLSEVVAGLPDLHLVHETVVTPWADKGAVMRLLVERSQGRQVELVDGVKVIHEDGWVLVLPDPEEPHTHVWAEATSDSTARQLAGEYATRIQDLAQGRG